MCVVNAAALLLVDGSCVVDAPRSCLLTACASLTLRALACCCAGYCIVITTVTIIVILGDHYRYHSALYGERNAPEDEHHEVTWGQDEAQTFIISEGSQDFGNADGRAVDTYERSAATL